MASFTARDQDQDQDQQSQLEALADRNGTSPLTHEQRAFSRGRVRTCGHSGWGWCFNPAFTHGNGPCNLAH